MTNKVYKLYNIEFVKLHNQNKNNQNTLSGYKTGERISLDESVTEFIALLLNTFLGLLIKRRANVKDFQKMFEKKYKRYLISQV